MNALIGNLYSKVDPLIVEGLVRSAALLALTLAFTRHYYGPVEDYIDELEKEMASILKRRFATKEPNVIEKRLIIVIKEWGRLIHKEYYYFIALKKSSQLAILSVLFLMGSYIFEFFGISNVSSFVPHQVNDFYQSIAPFSHQLQPYEQLKILSVITIFIALFLGLSVALKFGVNPSDKKPDPLKPF